MKVSGAKKVHYDSGPNMTPLVDVVMVILIFLMLAGSFGTAEHFMVSKTPIHAQGATAEAPPPGWKPPVQIDVRVNDIGDFSLSSVTNPSGRPVWMRDPEELRTRLEGMARQFESLDNVEVVLRPA